VHPKSQLSVTAGLADPVMEAHGDNDGPTVEDDSSASVVTISNSPFDHDDYFSKGREVPNNAFRRSHFEAAEREYLREPHGSRYRSRYGSPSPSPSPRPYARSSSSSSRARPEYPEAGSIYDVESEGDDPVDTGEPLPPEWVQPTTVLEDGTATELLIAHSIEHRVLKSGPERIVLICPSGPPPSSHPSQEKAQGQFRWL
jgi:hypothetical protein